MRRNILVGCALVSLFAMAANSEERCAELGRSRGYSPETPFERLDELNREEGRVDMSTTGVLSYGFEADFLCTDGLTLSPASPALPGECFALSFDWLRRRHGAQAVDRVLRQWNGSRVALEGALEEPPKRWELLFRVRKGAIRDISFLALVDGPVRAEYCPESDLPSLPSRFERETVKSGKGRGRCVDGTFSSLSTTAVSRALCVALTKPAVWDNSSPWGLRSPEAEDEWSEIPFVPPAPFATRDVTDFEALSDSLFFFTLANQRLYVWDGKESRELRSAFVDRLAKADDGWVYYRVRKDPKKDSVAPNSFRRVNVSLQPETLWESNDGKLEGFQLTPLSIRVRRGENVQTLVYDVVAETWVPE